MLLLQFNSIRCFICSLFLFSTLCQDRKNLHLHYESVRNSTFDVTLISNWMVESQWYAAHARSISSNQTLFIHPHPTEITAQSTTHTEQSLNWTQAKMYEKLLKDLKMVESIEDDYEMLRSIRKRLELDVQREVRVI